MAKPGWLLKPSYTYLKIQIILNKATKYRERSPPSLGGVPEGGGGNTAQTTTKSSPKNKSNKYNLNKKTPPPTQQNNQLKRYNRKHNHVTRSNTQPNLPQKVS